MMELEEMKKAMEVEASKIQEVQRNLNTLVDKNRQFQEKKNENDIVLKEFNMLNEQANVYKVVGPVMAKVPLAQAKDNVEKRLSFINGEIGKINQEIKKVEAEIEAKRNKVRRNNSKIMGIQQAMQTKYQEIMQRNQQVRAPDM